MRKQNTIAVLCLLVKKWVFPLQVPVLLLSLQNMMQQEHYRLSAICWINGASDEKKLMINKFLFTLSLASVLCVNVNAQNLPNLQKNSLRAPLNVKTDGKATEWGNQFQAHNGATEVFYTIANDDYNLYLTVQAQDHTIVNKILATGIVFSIDVTDKKSIQNAVQFTYPILEYNNRVWVNLKNQPQGNTKDETNAADSIMNFKNIEFVGKSRLVKVTGLEGVDSLLSIYNRDGVKAAGGFNNKLFYTYELALNLKKLGLDINKPAKFAYNITLPGVDEAAIYAASGQATTVVAGQYTIPVGPLPGYSEEYIAKHLPSLPIKIHEVTFVSTTNFWGEYVLIK